MADVTVGHVFRMDPLGAAAPHPLVVGTRHVGVEVELEGLGGAPHMNHWHVTGDGSLRDGVEFVFQGPKGGVDAFNALEELDATITKIGARLSWRCSAHAHFNMRDATASEIKRVTLATLFYEKLLFRLSGMQRYRNNFCPAFGFAQSQLTALSRIWHLNGEMFLRHLAQVTAKYSSLNFQPLAQFGTLEFRISEPKVQSGKLLRLVNRFLAMIELAKNFQGSDFEFVEHLRALNPEDVFVKGLPSEAVNYGDDLEVGFKLSMDLLAMAINYQRRLEEEEEERDPRVDDMFVPDPAAAVRPRAARPRAVRVQDELQFPDFPHDVQGQDAQNNGRPHIQAMDPAMLAEMQRAWERIHAQHMAQMEARMVAARAAPEGAQIVFDEAPQ